MTGEILMEHEITERNSKSAKNVLTKIVQFNTAICVILALTWACAASAYQQTNALAGISGVGLLLGLLVTISALNARLRIELEEPDGGIDESASGRFGLSA